MQVNLNQLGMVVDAPENSPFKNATFRGLGTLYSVKGQIEGSAFVEWVCPNGDKFYGRSKITGARGEGGHSVPELVGGTGTCKSIQGTVEIDLGPAVEPA